MNFFFTESGLNPPYPILLSYGYLSFDGWVIIFKPDFRTVGFIKLGIILV